MIFYGRRVDATVPGIARVHGLDRVPLAREPLTVPFLPDGESSLVVHDTHGRLDVIIAGPRTHAKYRTYVPASFYTQLVLSPAAARRIVGAPISELTDRAVAIEDVWGKRGRDLRERLAACAGNVAKTIAVLTAEVSAESTAGVAHAVRALDAGTSVADVATTLGIGERAVRRLFLEHIGVAPKLFARIARIRRAARAVGKQSLADLAASHGFYDQPHLNAEFRALLGMSPGAFIRAQFALAH